MPKTTITPRTQPGRLFVRDVHVIAKEKIGDKAKEAMERGLSYVGGKEIDIGRLLDGFWPTDNVAKDIQRIEMVPPFIRPYGCAPSQAPRYMRGV